MALSLYPNSTISNNVGPQLTPATLNQPYTNQQQPFVATGGTSPYTYAVTSGNLPPGITLATTTTAGGEGILNGVPRICDQYQIGINAQVPIIQNASTFTITVTDALAATASVTYTLPVSLFSEPECLTIYEMLRAVYNTDYYIMMDTMGTRQVKIGDIGSAQYGPIRLIINSYLNGFTQGMVDRMRYYICQFDRIKLAAQRQKDGGVPGITGISYNFDDKQMKILEFVKSLLPVFTLNEANSKVRAEGPSDSMRILGGAVGGSGPGFVTLVR